jgi:hypothetical protein
MTARVPGAKRGRPAKPKDPDRPRQGTGRPVTPLSERPNRYFFACYEAIIGNGLSRRAAIRILEAARLDYLTVTDKAVLLMLNQRDRDIFFKHCERLRAIARWHASRPDDLAWLRPMSEAIRIASGPWHPEAADTVLRLAMSANETAWAKRVLLPALRAKEPAVQEFAGILVPA